MREHMGLFRGKHPNGMWVYGSLAVFRNIKNEPYTAIIPVEDGENQIRKLTRIDPDTVGECTGLKDKNGKLIFEGDLLKPFDDEIDKMVVEFYSGVFMLSLYGDRGYLTEYGWECEGNYGVFECEPLESYGADVEIIGNIHDNPELLEGTEDDA